MTRGDDAIVHLARAGGVAALAEAAALAAEHAAGLVLTGGETARAVCDRVGVRAIELCGEVEPGVPLGRIASPARAVVTKAGAFGDPGTLCRAVDAVRSARAVIAVTMGDPAGIGPEIIVGALAQEDIPAVVIGDAARLRAAAADPRERRGDRRRRAAGRPRPGGRDRLPRPRPGRPRAAVGRALGAGAGEGAYRAVERAVELALAGEVDAICTAPLNKEALHLAGHRYPGHTELLAELTGTDGLRDDADHPVAARDPRHHARRADRRDRGDRARRASSA